MTVGRLTKKDMFNAQNGLQFKDAGKSEWTLEVTGMGIIMKVDEKKIKENDFDAPMKEISVIKGILDGAEVIISGASAVIAKNIRDLSEMIDDGEDITFEGLPVVIKFCEVKAGKGTAVSFMLV